MYIFSLTTNTIQSKAFQNKKAKKNEKNKKKIMEIMHRHQRVTTG